MKLDVGCGNFKEGDIGIDIEPPSSLRTPNEADIVADAHYLPFRDNLFDEAYSCLCVGLYTGTQAIDEMIRVCKSDGSITIVINIEDTIWVIDHIFTHNEVVFRLIESGSQRTRYSGELCHVKIVLRKSPRWSNITAAIPSYRKRVTHPAIIYTY